MSPTTARWLTGFMAIVAVAGLVYLAVGIEQDPVADARAQCAAAGGVPVTVTSSAIDRKHVVCFDKKSFLKGAP